MTRSELYFYNADFMENGEGRGKLNRPNVKPRASARGASREEMEMWGPAGRKQRWELLTGLGPGNLKTTSSFFGDRKLIT